jgi:hypothetical protein
MKKLWFAISIALALLMAATPALAISSGTQNVAWNLSGSVMPTPPYGTFGSLDSNYVQARANSTLSVTVSKTKPTDVAMTACFSNLKPNTNYRLTLSNSYTPYVDTGWDTTGSYVINVNYLSVDYPENLVLAQSGPNITGTSLILVTPPGGSPWTITGGSVTGINVVFNAYYNSNPSNTAQFVGTINTSNGSMSGTWGDTAGGSRTGTWASTSGAALHTHTGDTAWTGLFSTNIPAILFKSDKHGANCGTIHTYTPAPAGSKRLVKPTFPITGTSYTMSFWLDVMSPTPTTVLISNNFSVFIPVQ